MMSVPSGLPSEGTLHTPGSGLQERAGSLVPRGTLRGSSKRHLARDRHARRLHGRDGDGCIWAPWPADGWRATPCENRSRRHLGHQHSCGVRRCGSEGPLVTSTVRSMTLHTTSHVVTRLCVALAIAAVPACSDRIGDERKDHAAASTLRLKADTGLELRVMLERDTVSAKDSNPVRILYFVVNGPALTDLDNDPDRYSFRLTRMDNSLVQPESWSSPILGSQGDRVKIALPGSSFLGQVQDLRCIVHGHYVAGLRKRTCTASYDLRDPGTYKVIVEYRGRSPINFDSLTALADSGKLEQPIKYHRRGGRHLADTATLVVVR